MTETFVTATDKKWSLAQLCKLLMVNPYDVIDTFFESLGKTGHLENKIMDCKSQPSGRKCKNLPNGWKCNEK